MLSKFTGWITIDPDNKIERKNPPEITGKIDQFKPSWMIPTVKHERPKTSVGTFTEAHRKRKLKDTATTISLGFESKKMSVCSSHQPTAEAKAADFWKACAVYSGNMLEHRPVSRARSVCSDIPIKPYSAHAN